MRLILLAMFLAAAAAADEAGAQAPADLPRMTPAAYAAMMARGEELRLKVRESLVGDKPTRPIEVRHQKERLAPIDAQKGKMLPACELEIGSSGKLVGRYLVEQVLAPTSTLITDAESGQTIWVDGIDNTQLVDGSVFSTGEAILEADGRRTYQSAAGVAVTVLHMRAVLPPVDP